MGFLYRPPWPPPRPRVPSLGSPSISALTPSPLLMALPMGTCVRAHAHSVIVARRTVTPSGELRNALKGPAPPNLKAPRFILSTSKAQARAHPKINASAFPDGTVFGLSVKLYVKWAIRRGESVGVNAQPQGCVLRCAALCCCTCLSLLCAAALAWRCTGREVP